MYYYFFLMVLKKLELRQFYGLLKVTWALGPVITVSHG